MVTSYWGEELIDKYNKAHEASVGHTIITTMSTAYSPVCSDRHRMSSCERQTVAQKLS